MIVKVSNVLGMQVICGARGYSALHFIDRPVVGESYELKDGRFYRLEFKNGFYGRVKKQCQ